MELNNNSNNKYFDINDIENRVIDNLNRLIELKGISQNSLVQIIKKKGILTLTKVLYQKYSLTNKKDLDSYKYR